MTSPLPPAELRARVLAAAIAEPMRPRAAGVGRSPLVVLAGFLPALALSLFVGGPGVGDRPAAYTAFLAVAWLAVAVLATVASVSRGTSMLGRPSSWRLAAAALTPATLLGTALVAMALWPSVAAGHAVLRDHAVCVVATLLCGLGPLASFAFVRRGSEPVLPRLTGAAIGAAAGAWGALFIELHCAHASWDHVVLGHLAPVALLTLVGVIVGDRVLAVRAAHD
ncbi:MAG: NrsF family protein, partial [Polyangiaceae bacterium]